MMNDYDEVFAQLAEKNARIAELEEELDCCAQLDAIRSAARGYKLTGILYRKQLDNVLTGIAEAEDQDILWSNRLGTAIIQELQASIDAAKKICEKAVNPDVSLAGAMYKALTTTHPEREGNDETL